MDPLFFLGVCLIAVLVVAGMWLVTRKQQL